MIASGAHPRAIRIGQIVPSSNTTMETEIPALLRARELIQPDRFTFHSSRMRMKQVRKEELEAMDRESLRCAAELADARVDVMGYACLVAIMAMGQGYHRDSERRLTSIATENQCESPVVTSAGALIEALKAIKARRVTVIAPYMKPLASLVADYIASEGIEIVDLLALEIEDNLMVGRRPALALLEDLKRVSIKGADALVLSACVQMPSLAAIEPAQAKTGLPVLSSAVATTWAMLRSLNMAPVAPGGGWLLGETNGALNRATADET
jgi:maleate isomerase